MHIRKPDSSRNWRAVMVRLCWWGIRCSRDEGFRRDLRRLIRRRDELAQDVCELIVNDLFRELLADVDTVH